MVQPCEGRGLRATLFLSYIAGIKPLLSNFFCLFVYYIAPFLVFWLGRACFCWPPFFHLCVLAFLDFRFLQLHIWDISSNAKTQVSHHSVIPWAPRPLAGLPSLKHSFMLILCVMSRVLVVLSSRNRENYFYSIFIEAHSTFFTQV